MNLKQREEDMERQALLAEQRREEERLLQEEREREELERAKAAEGAYKLEGSPVGMNMNAGSDDAGSNTHAAVLC